MESINDRIIEIIHSVEGIQGWMDSTSGAFLYHIARFSAPKPLIVELGSWKGLSTAWLASGIKDRGEGMVYAVDTWKGSPGEDLHQNMLREYEENQLHEEFISNIARLGLSDYVTPVLSDTGLAARKWISQYNEANIGLLFIDASHDYASVRRDFEYWSPMVLPWGFVVFDDVPSWPGPTRVVSELPQWMVKSGEGPNIWIGQKIGETK